jgi:glycosyltransferase involved in cell wall biosynthesis
MTKRKESISVIFPAFNEEANINKTIEQAFQILSEVTDNWEVVVVDDGSTDRTGEIIKRYNNLKYKFKAIHHPHNKGYGAALKSGITSAKNDLIFFSDSDQQFDLRELKKLLQWIDGYDIIIGYRAKRQDPFYRRLNAFGWNMLVRLLLGLKVRDIDCAFKLFRRAVFGKVKINAVGAMVSTEILSQAVKYGFGIKEVPVSHFPRVKGKQTGANPKVILRAFKELLKLYKKLKVLPNPQKHLTES